MRTDPRTTLRTLLLEGARLLSREFDAEEAGASAKRLLLHAFSMDMEAYLIAADDPLTAEQEMAMESYRAMLKERMRHVPVAYLTGFCYFMGLRLKITPGVLIPRQDSECLIEWIAGKVRSEIGEGSCREPVRILDLCAGSGCLGLSLADELRRSGISYSLSMSDISPVAVKLALENAKRSGISAHVYEGDLLEPLPRGETFDTILCNPPYIADSESSALSPDVREHEPREALFGGEDGLSFYRRLFPDIHFYLKPGGYALFEIGYQQAEDVKAIASKDESLRFLEIIRDREQRDRGIALCLDQ